jgi:putative membrane protein
MGNEGAADRRRGSWWLDPDVGDEPDYRFTLANERTFLAWVRTSLALLAGGVAVREFVDPFEVEGARRGLAAFAIAVSLASVILGYRRWVGAQQAMRVGAPLPGNVGIPVVAAGLALLAAAALLLVLVG